MSPLVSRVILSPAARGVMELVAVRNRRTVVVHGVASDKKGLTARQGMTCERSWARQ